MSTESGRVSQLITRLDNLDCLNHSLIKQNRILKRIGIVSIMTLGVFLLMGAQNPKSKSIDTEKLVLRDKDGNERLVIEAGAGKESLILKDQKGKKRLILIADESLAGVFVYDAQEKRRGSIATDIEGRLGLELYYPNDKRCISFGMGKTGPALRFFDKDGAQRGVLGTIGDGTALILGDKNGKKRVGLIQGEEETALQLLDKSENPLVDIGTKNDGPFLVLTNSNGKAVFSKP